MANKLQQGQTHRFSHAHNKSGEHTVIIPSESERETEVATHTTWSPPKLVSSGGTLILCELNQALIVFLNSSERIGMLMIKLMAMVESVQQQHLIMDKKGEPSVDDRLNPSWSPGAPSPFSFLAVMKMMTDSTLKLIIIITETSSQILYSSCLFILLFCNNAVQVGSRPESSIPSEELGLKTILSNIVVPEGYRIRETQSC